MLYTKHNENKYAENKRTRQFNLTGKYGKIPELEELDHNGLELEVAHTINIQHTSCQ